MPITLTPVNGGGKMKKSYKSGPRFGPNAWSYRDKSVQESSQEVKNVDVILPVEQVVIPEQPILVVEDSQEKSEELSSDSTVEEKLTEVKQEVKTSSQERRKR